MDQFKKVNAGSPVKIHHKTWNACIDLVKAQKNQTSIKPPGYRPPHEHDPNITDVDTSGSNSIFSMIGIDGRITAHSEDLSEFLNQPILQELTSDIHHYGVLQRPSDGDVVETVTDGLTLCRVKLMQDPESLTVGIGMHRCTPSGGNYFYADTIGTNELIWHGSKVHDSPETDAGKGDTVWGIVRLGDLVQQTVHVELNFKDGYAKPIDPEGHYDAKLRHQNHNGGTISGDVWLELISGPPSSWFWEEQELVFTGYFIGYSTRDNDDGESEERPVISCSWNPIQRLFGKWTTATGDTGTVEIYKDKSTAVTDYSKESICLLGDVDGDAWVKIEWLPGSGWEVYAQQCGGS